MSVKPVAHQFILTKGYEVPTVLGEDPVGIKVMSVLREDGYSCNYDFEKHEVIIYDTETAKDPESSEKPLSVMEYTRFNRIKDVLKKAGVGEKISLYKPSEPSYACLRVRLSLSEAEKAEARAESTFNSWSTWMAKFPSTPSSSSSSSSSSASSSSIT